MKGNFLNELQKRGVNIADTIIGTEDPRANSYLQEYKKRKKQEEELGPVGMVGTLASLKNDIGPVKDDEGLDFFQKGAFSDGYQFGDVAKTILGTAADLGTNVVKGAGGLVEGITDLAQYGVAGVSDLLGADRAADKIRAGAKKNTVEGFFRPADEFYNKYSVLGRTSDAIAQGIGQVGSIMLTGGLAGAAGLSATAVTTGAMGLSGMGSGMSQAYQEGASDGEAMAYGAIAGAADAITELIFGGMGKAVNAVGFSKGLSSADDMLAKKISSKISSQLGKNLAEFGVKASGEGFEEVLAGVLQAAGKKATYMSEKEFSDILEDENLLEQFIVGAATSGVVQSGLIPGTQDGSLKESIKENKDFITGQTVNEQAVIKKEIEKRIAEQEKDGRKLTAREKSAIEAQVEADLPKGGISTDTIEEVLGGDDYKAYKDTVDREEALKKEYETLLDLKEDDVTVRQRKRLTEIESLLPDIEKGTKRNQMKAELSKKVYELSKSDRLVESYLEPVRAKQKFTADLSKYEGKAKEVIKQVMDSGLADNTNATHDFWDMVAKVANDRDTSFTLADNQKILEMVKAEYEADGVEFDESKFKGQTVDGFVSKNGIVLNAESKRALNFVVGHEITHTLEKSKHYEGLRDALKEYAAKEFDTRFAKRMEQYKGKYNEATLKTEVEMEVIADLVGDFLFTDQNFVNHLSTSNRNVFQKMFDEIKHLLKLATAGSKEARELERVKHLFEKAYKDTAATKNTATDSGANSKSVKYALRDAKIPTREELNKKDPVKVVDISTAQTKGTFAERRKQIMEKASEVIAKPYLNRDTGAMIFLTEKSYEHTFSNPGEIQLNAVEHLPELIENAVLTHSEKPTHGSEYADGVYTFFAAAKADQVRPVKLKVKEYHYKGQELPKNIKAYFDGLPEGYAASYDTVVLEVEEIEKSPSGSAKDMNQEDSFLSPEELSTITVADLLDLVKGYSEKYIPKLSLSDLSEADQAEAKPTDNPDIRFSLSEDSDVSRAINESMTMQEAKQMIQRAFVLGNIKEWYDGEYKNGDEWLKAQGAEDVAMIIENEYTLQAAYIDKIPGLLNEDFFMTDILDAYSAGTLTGKVKKKAERVNIADGVVVADKRFYAPQEIENAKSLYEVANQRLSQSNKEDVAKARAAILLYAHNKGAAETLGITDSELNKKLRSWGGYSAKARDISMRINAGANSSNRWTGIESVSWLNKSTVSNDEVARMVQSVEGDADGFQTKYIARTMLALDTHIDWSWLKIKFDTYAGVNRDSTSGKCNGYYSNKDRLVHVKNDAPNTVAHEMGHALDYQWGRDLGYPSTALTEISRNTEHISGEAKVWFDSFKEFADSLVASSDIRSEYSMDVKETFARFVSKFVEWTEQIGTGRSSGYESNYYNDKFTGAQFVQFARLLQEKSAIDANGKTENKFSLSDIGEEHPVYGSYHYYSKYNPAAQDIAPVQDSVQDSVQTPVQDILPDDYAPAVEETADMQSERLGSLTEADMPAEAETEYLEMADAIPLTQKVVKDIAKSVKGMLGLSNNQVGEVYSIVLDYSGREFPSREALFNEVAERFGQYTEKGVDEDLKAIKAELRNARVYVDDAIKGDITDYGQFKKRNFGKIRFSNEGLPVDVVYMELAEKYPGYFPEDIINPSEQLQRMAEIAGYDHNTEQVYELDDEMLLGVTDSIINAVNEFKAGKRAAFAQKTARESFNSLMRDADSYVPPMDGDIGPVAAPAAQTPVAPVVQEAPVANQPIKTVKERLATKLQNYQTELANTKALRDQSNADYDSEIERLQAEHDAKANKNTVAANNILLRIERMRSMKGNVDADYAKRISDMEANVAKVKEEIRTGESKAEQGAMRRELHQNIMDRIKTRFAEKGFDFDSVLKKAKNLSTFATVDNTPQRVMEKSLGYKEGQVLSDLTVDQVARNETEGIKWLNKYTDKKNGLLAQISKQYNIKPGSKESAAAQMYAEGFYVAENEDIIEYGDKELAKDFPDARVQANIKGLAKDPRIRQIYDETLALINDSRTRNAYPEIQKLENYFLHFRAMGDTFSKLGLPFNPNDIRAKDLPTDLNGVTADLKPGQPYFASANHRTGQRTSFDLLGGLEMYLTSAKGQIYHIDDIQTLRALRNYIADTYGQANGLEGLDNLTEEEVQDRIEQVYGSHLSTFAKFLNEEANVLAGKTALIDRGLEGIIGRRGMTFLETVNRQVGANMVGYNVSSSLTNFLAPVQAFAKTNKADFMKAFSQTVYNKLASINGKGDGFAAQSSVMIRRKGADRFHRTFWQKLSDPGYALMGAVDSFSTELIARAKYNEFTRKGMDAAQAHIEADKWTSRLMGDRSLGQQPHLYNSKMLGIVTKFQLEVRNQLDSQFYDTIQEAKVSNEDIQNAQERNAKTAAKVASTFFSLAVGQHLFGKVFESIAGYNPAFDIIEALAKAFGWDDDEEDEDTVLDNIGQGFMSLMEDMPYSSVLTGGRIPIQSALPISEFFKGKDQYGNEKSRLETLSEAAPYYLLPGGYGQIKKTVAGLNMFSDEHPVAGSYTDSGNLRFPVEDTLLNRAQAAVFGQYASSNARDYFDNERQSLKKNQIQEFVDVDIPIRDYWEYRGGLKKQETLEDKFDYIAGLDLPISKKNILINNVVDRKEPVDLSDYDAYSGYEEFDFATKNPEKYAFFEEVGISYSAYKNGDDDTKDAYDWAYNNPVKYLLSKAAASDVVEYRRYTKDLYDIKADKDASGKTISGSRKEKVIQYINNLDIDYGERLILFKSEYEADDTYNADIVEYLNGRDDISFEEEVTILKELGFIVLPDGTVQW